MNLTSLPFSAEWFGTIIAALAAVISLIFSLLSFRQSQKALARADNAIGIEERSLRNESLRLTVEKIHRIENRVESIIDELARINTQNKWGSTGLMCKHFLEKFEQNKKAIRAVVFENRIFLDDEFFHEIYTKIDLWMLDEAKFSISSGDSRILALDLMPVFSDLLDLIGKIEVEFALGERSWEVRRIGPSAAAPGAMAARRIPG